MRTTALGTRARGLATSVFALISFTLPAVSAAQEHPARRLSNIVGVAVEEYGKAVDDRGRLTSSTEFQEAVGFLADAKQVAERLAGDRAMSARLVLDTLDAAVVAMKPAAEVMAIHARFTAALGAEGALEMPTRDMNIASGKTIYQSKCASCHGMNGAGGGPAARGMMPAPPALASDTVVAGTSPATMFRIISVGVSGTPMQGWASSLSPEERWDVVAYLTSLRANPRVLSGEGLYLQRCASCHGMANASAAYARALTKLPPEIATLAWQAERSDVEIARVVREGIPGTAMPASRDLTPDETRNIVAYLRSMPLRNGAATTAAHTTGDVAVDAPQVVLSTLDQALNAARDGRTSDAGDRAFDAYIAFEPLERTTRAKNPGLIAGMEQHFAEFKAAVKRNDVRAAERARDAIELSLPTVVELMRPPASGWGAFFESFLIILREGFEAILVIGAVVAFLLKTGHRERLSSIWVGVGLGLGASAVTAVVLATVLSAIPASREILEGATLLVAVVVLFSVSYWLISKVEAAKWQQFIRDKVTNALSHGGGKALALVAFLAVYREGAETALFFQALFREGGAVALPLTLGILVGFAALAVIFTLFYRFGVRIPLRPFFSVTSALLYYMAFVFAGKGIKELQEGNVMTATRLPGFPTVTAMGIFPTVETLLVQLLLIAAFVFAIVKTFWPSRSVALPTIPPDAVPASGDVLQRVAELSEQNARLQARLAALEDADAARRDDTLASKKLSR
jgi:high-affinity iron transporter